MGVTVFNTPTTYNSTTFVQAFEDALQDYVASKSKQYNIGDRIQYTMREFRIVLAEYMVEIIRHWFRTTTTTDDNFMTVGEIQTVIDHANRILGTHYYIDLSDYA